MSLGWKNLYTKNTMKCRPEWKSFPCLTSYTDLEWKLSQHFSSMTTFYHKKTLSETDFLSVSILDCCIEMPQLHKLPLSQYLSMWLEFPLFLHNCYWIFARHTLFPCSQITLFLPRYPLIAISIRFIGMAWKLICADREILEKIINKTNMYRKLIVTANMFKSKQKKVYKWYVCMNTFISMLYKHAASMPSIKHRTLYTHTPRQSCLCIFRFSSWHLFQSLIISHES